MTYPCDTTPHRRTKGVEMILNQGKNLITYTRSGGTYGSLILVLEEHMAHARPRKYSTIIRIIYQKQ